MIYTCNMGTSKKLLASGFCTRYNLVDITVKSGNNIFAPSWEIVNNVKSGKITEQEYTKAYQIMMRNSYLCNKPQWQHLSKLASEDNVIFLCYCPAGDFCHRLLLAEMFVKLGNLYGGELRGDEVKAKKKYTVNLKYFKPTGKYYDSGFYETEKEFTFQVCDEIKEMRDKDELPGIGGNDWIISVEMPEDYPNKFPALILPEKYRQAIIKIQDSKYK